MTRPSFRQASANLEKTRDSAQPGGSGEADSTLSMSDYFAIRTSAIGSLEKDLDKIGGMPRRPDFGFDGGAPRRYSLLKSFDLSAALTLTNFDSKYSGLIY